MKQLFTTREAAEITGTSKSTIRRYLEALQDAGKIPPEGIAHEQRAGHTVILLSAATVEALKAAMNDSSTNQATVYGTNHNAHQDAPDAPESDPRTAELLSELRARIADKEREITRQEKELDAKQATIDTLKAALETAQQATAAAQALHAATAEQLRRLTAQAAPEPPQDRAEPERATDTTPAADEAQEAASAPTEAPAPEITGSGQEAPPERATLAQRLRFLFTGRNSP